MKYKFLRVSLLSAFTVLFGGTAFGAFMAADEGNKLTDFPNSKDGIEIVEGGTASFTTVKIHENKDAVDCIKFANSGTNNGVALTVDGGFKAGDVIEIAGAVSLKAADEGTKRACVDIYTETNGTQTKTFTTKDFINGQLSADDPVIETFTLESDCEKLVISRNGNTGANVTLLTVTRASAGGEEPGVGGDFGDASIEGEWNVTTDWHYAGDWSLGEQTDVYTATLEGNVVTFTSEYGEKFIAEFTAENTLTFKVAAVSDPATYTMTQSPFVDGTGVTDTGIDPENFVFESFNATYDSEKGTITFPEGVGLAFGPANAAGEFSYYQDAFDFVSATKVGGTTGINTVNAQSENGNIYNLQGQKVEKAQKGLYIINGKKMIVK